MEKTSIGELIALLLLISLVLVTTGTVVSYQQDILSSEFATLIISGISALASAVLAAATFTTIRQNKTTVDELKKDREKAVILDLLQQLFTPSISRLEYIDKLKSGNSIWYSTKNSSGVNIKQPPEKNEFDPATWKLFEEEYTEIYTQFERWWTLRIELQKAIKQYYDDIYPYIDEFPTTEERSSDIPTTDRVISVLINNENTNSDSEFWNEYEDELRALSYTECRESFTSMRQLSQQLFNHLDNTKDQLIDEKLQLQREYGISNGEIDT